MHINVLRTNLGRWTTSAGVILFLSSVGSIASAHDLHSGFLELRETSPRRFDATWRPPTINGKAVPVRIKLPDGASTLKDVVAEDAAGIHSEKWSFELSGNTAPRLEFSGLEESPTSALVLVKLVDNRTWTTVIQPTQPWVEIYSSLTSFDTACGFLVEGVRHILFGVDHLLFVFGLLMIVQDWLTLLKTVTAFTIAHSLTLAIATLGYSNPPVQPLNAVIASSILFLAPEMLRASQSRTSLTIRQPWIVAFIFGLVHGFGFASALTHAGLQSYYLPTALLWFNVGVELGQIGFILVIYCLDRSFRRLQLHWPRFAMALPAYVVGTVGAFWTLERTATMLGFQP